MATWQDYWDLFVLVEMASLRSGIDSLLHPSIRLHPYLLVIAGFLLWEWIHPWRPNQRRFRSGFGLDAFYTIFNYLLFWMLIGTAVCELSALLFRDALSHFFGMEHFVALRLDGLPVWLRYVLLVLVLDLTSWAGHWMLHRFDILWAFHQVHHSARELDVLNAGRIHFVEKLFYPFVFYLPVSLIGFEVENVFYAGLFISILSAFTHANVRIPLGPLRYVVNNPQIHLWHHAASVPDQRNVNYGDALCLWDYLFGTAYLPEERGDLELGFDGIDAYPTSFRGQLVAPFRLLRSNDG